MSKLRTTSLYRKQGLVNGLVGFCFKGSLFCVFFDAAGLGAFEDLIALSIGLPPSTQGRVLNPYPGLQGHFQCIASFI